MFWGTSSKIVTELQDKMKVEWLLINDKMLLKNWGIPLLAPSRVKTFRTTSVTDFMNLVRKFVKPFSRHVIRPEENMFMNINK